MQFAILARIKDEQYRNYLDLGDGWDVHTYFHNEANAIHEMAFLTGMRHALRDYVLVGYHLPPLPSEVLNDPIPF